MRSRSNHRHDCVCAVEGEVRIYALLRKGVGVGFSFSAFVK